MGAFLFKRVLAENRPTDTPGASVSNRSLTVRNPLCRKPDHLGGWASWRTHLRHEAAAISSNATISVYPRCLACCSGVTPSPSARLTSAPESTSIRTISTWAGPPSERTIASSNPVQFSLLTWFTSTPASINMRTVSTCPRSHAGISAVPPYRLVLARSAP